MDQVGRQTVTYLLQVDIYLKESEIICQGCYSVRLRGQSSCLSSYNHEEIDIKLLTIHPSLKEDVLKLMEKKLQVVNERDCKMGKFGLQAIGEIL